MPQTSPGKRSVSAYNRMMERVKASLEQSDTKTLQKLAYAIQQAQDKAVALNEVSREEAEKIGNYLRRDLEDAGAYLADTGSELRTWLHFDLELIEERLRELFIAAADQTRLAFLQLAERAQRASEYHSGDVTSVGTLQCKHCGELLHFHGTAHIPPCPNCHQARFVRKPRS